MLVDQGVVLGRGAQGTVHPCVFQESPDQGECAGSLEPNGSACCDDSPSQREHVLYVTGRFGPGQLPVGAAKLGQATCAGVHPELFRESCLACLVECAVKVVYPMAHVQQALGGNATQATAFAYEIGTPLEKYLENVRIDTPDGASTRDMLAKQVWDFLPSLHKAGVSHNDINVRNIIVVNGSARLGDFGSGHLEGVGKCPFPPCCSGYRPPEVVLLAAMMEARARAEHRAPLVHFHNAPFQSADVWAAAVAVYSILKGRLPYPTEPNDTTLAQLNATMPSISDNFAVEFAEYARPLLKGISVCDIKQQHAAETCKLERTARQPILEPCSGEASHILEVNYVLCSGAGPYARTKLRGRCLFV